MTSVSKKLELVINKATYAIGLLLILLNIVLFTCDYLEYTEKVDKTIEDARVAFPRFSKAVFHWLDYFTYSEYHPIKSTRRFFMNLKQSYQSFAYHVLHEENEIVLSFKEIWLRPYIYREGYDVHYILHLGFESFFLHLRDSNLQIAQIYDIMLITAALTAGYTLFAVIREKKDAGRGAGEVGSTPYEDAVEQLGLWVVSESRLTVQRYFIVALFLIAFNSIVCGIPDSYIYGWRTVHEGWCSGLVYAGFWSFFLTIILFFIRIVPSHSRYF